MECAGIKIGVVRPLEDAEFVVKGNKLEIGGVAKGSVKGAVEKRKEIGLANKAVIKSEKQGEGTRLLEMGDADVIVSRHKMGPFQVGGW